MVESQELLHSHAAPDAAEKTEFCEACLAPIAAVELAQALVHGKVRCAKCQGAPLNAHVASVEASGFRFGV